MTEPSFVHEARQYLAIIHKRRALFVTCLAASIIVATLYNYTTRPLYRATTRILIDRSTPNILPTKELVEMQSGTEVFMTQVQLLNGRSLAERVVEKFELNKSAEFQTGPLMSPWERFQRKFLGRSPIAVDSQGIPLPPAVAAFRSRVSIEPLVGTRLVDIHVTAFDPAFAAKAANGLAQVYIEQSLEFRFTTSNDASEWLSDRLKEHGQQVADSERILQEYREREGLVNIEERQGLVDQKLTTLNGAILTARTERLAKETLLNQLKQLPPAQLETHPHVVASPLIASLRTQLMELQRKQTQLSETLGDKHPEMVEVRRQTHAFEEKIRSELDGVLRSMEAEVQAARQQEANLQASLEAAKQEGLEINRKAIDYGKLKREVDAGQEMYQSLMKKSKATNLESELKATNIRIDEKAEVPRGPFLPNRTRNYQMALLVGLALGLAFCLLFEHLDNTFKTPDDVKEYLGLPFLGMVPDVNARSTGPTVTRTSPLILRSPKSAVAEAYRVLRTNLIFSSADRSGGRVLAVSSANPGEGKTTTVANLAASLAINGSRVLAVDADLRRPTMHQHFGIAKTPGLSDLIVGKAKPSEAIHKTQFSGLQILPCGYVPPNPTELLGSASLREILAALRTHYDWVLIDTPPILAMADTSVLCPLMDGLAIVIGAETSSRPAVARAIDQIRSVNGRLMGVILNKVNFERNSYYYGQYYGEYYRSYYAEKQEQRTGVAGVREPGRARRM
jgi:capsular exopolysaccharide synthesis family protein